MEIFYLVVRYIIKVSQKNYGMHQASGGRHRDKKSEDAAQDKNVDYILMIKKHCAFCVLRFHHG
jgi:hypothetical protein